METPPYTNTSLSVRQIPEKKPPTLKLFRI